MRSSAAIAMLVALTLGACNQQAGPSTDPSDASTCAELADIAINQLSAFIGDAAGTRSYEEFVEAFEADWG